jgi:hypothetical protein
MTETQFCETVGRTKFFEIKSRYRIEGGRGHGLYEIYRVARETVEGKHAALISKHYFNYLRGFPDEKVYKLLEREINAIVKANPMIFHV